MFGKKPCPCGCGEQLGGTRWKAMREHQENAEYLSALSDLSYPDTSQAATTDEAMAMVMNYDSGRAGKLLIEGFDINDGLEAYGHHGYSRGLPGLRARMAFQVSAANVIGRKVKH